MDWEKVVEKLLELSNMHARLADEHAMRPGMFSAVEQHRTLSDVMIGLAAALDHGRSR